MTYLHLLATAGSLILPGLLLLAPLAAVLALVGLLADAGSALARSVAGTDLTDMLATRSDAALGRFKQRCWLLKDG